MTLIAKTVADYGRLDILVNNAGISGSSVGDPDGLEGWQRVTAVNQTSVFLWAPSSPPSRWQKPAAARSSTSAQIMGFVGGASGHPAYSASKGAVRIYAKSAGGALPAEVPDSASPSRLEPGPLLAIQASGRCSDHAVSTSRHRASASVERT